MSESSQEHIAVAVRVRPLNASEKNRGDRVCWNCNTEYNYLHQVDENGGVIPNTNFYYDCVFGPESTTVNVYQGIGKRIVESFLRGVNGRYKLRESLVGTIFAYGQTSSGKTYTMHGDDNSPGLLYLAGNEIFDYVANTTSREFILRASYIELYKEEVKDLLDPKNLNPRIRESDTRGVYVEACERVITSYDDMLQLLQEGEKHRHVGVTNMNQQSSRSHTIFRIICESRLRQELVESTDDPGGVLVGQLSLVDLAGSENVKHTEAKGERLEEAKKINLSLSTLSRVISALANKTSETGHVAYRDSKLTRILQSSLDGNARTAIIACVTPSSSFSAETSNTLRFAQRAKNIHTSAKVNEMLDDKAIIRKLRREIESLKQQVQTLQTSSSSSSSSSSTYASSALSPLMPIPAGVEAFLSSVNAREEAGREGLSSETQKTLDALNKTIKDQELTICQLTSEKSIMQVTLGIASMEKDGLQREKQSVEEELKQTREKLERMQEMQDWEEKERKEKEIQMEMEEEEEEKKLQEQQRREKEESQREIARLLEEKAKLEELCAQYQHEVKEKEFNIKELADQLSVLLPQSNKLQQELNDVRQQYNALSHTHSVLQQTYSTAEKELEVRTTAYTQLEESICVMREEENKLRTQLQRMEEEKTEIVTTSREDEMKVEALEKEREQMSQLARESLEGLEALQEQFQREKSEKEGLQEEIRRLKQVVEETLEEKERLAGLQEEQETKLQAIQESLQTVTQERDGHAATVATLTAALEEREAAMASLSSELQAKDAKQQALEAQSKLIEKKGKGESRQLRQTISALEGERQKLQEQLETSQEAVRSSERFVKQLQVEIRSLQCAIECTDEELQTMDCKQAFDWDDMELLRKQIHELRREKENAEAEAIRLREIMEGLRGSYADGYREADALQRELNESEGLLAIARDSYAKATARISELENDVKNHTELAQREQVEQQAMIARLQEESTSLRKALEEERQQREALRVQNTELQEKLRTTEGELGLLLHKDEGDLSEITSFTHSTLSPSPRPSQSGEDDHDMNSKKDKTGAVSQGKKMSLSDASSSGGMNANNHLGTPSYDVNGNVIRGLEQVMSSSPSSSSPETSQKGPAPSIEEMEALREELKESEEKFLRLQQTMKAKYGEYKAMCERVQDLEHQGEELQQYSSQLESINGRLNDNLKVMNEKYKAAKEQISSLKEQIVPKEQIKAMKHVIQTKRKLEEYNKKLMERELVLKEELLQAKRARTKAEQSAQEARLSLQEQEQRAQESEQELSSMRDSLKEAMIKSEQLERDLMEAQNSTVMSTYGSSRSYLENENLKLSVKVDELKQELSEVREQLRQQTEREERQRDDSRGAQRSSQWMGVGGNSAGITTGGTGGTRNMAGMPGSTATARGEEEESGRRWSVIRPYHTQGTNGVRESPAKMKRVSDFNADVSNCNPQ